MYCVKCGVKLADTEKQCPLCGTVVFHPEVHQEEAEPLFPKGKNRPPRAKRSFLLQYIITVFFLCPMLISLECDLQLNHTVTWSGFVIGGMLVAYVIALPMWFRKLNPVWYVPSIFAAVILYLLYINYAVGGRWFMSFAFPVAGGFGLIASALTALLVYVKRGKLYMFGGASLLTGGMMLLIEFLLRISFDIVGYVGWSLYPCTVFALLGGTLIFLAICEPAREEVERKMFL